MATANIYASEKLVIVKTPYYNGAFVEDLKDAVPPRARWFNENDVTWELLPQYLETVTALARDYFTDVIVDYFTGVFDYEDVLEAEEEEGPRQDQKHYRKETRTPPPQAEPTGVWGRLRGLIDDEDLRMIRRLLAKRYHPDTKPKDPNKMALINKLFDEMGLK